MVKRRIVLVDIDGTISDSSGRAAKILEDRNSMVKKWRELGYTCLQVAEDDF